jgi:hypothetical protein
MPGTTALAVTPRAPNSRATPRESNHARFRGRVGRLASGRRERRYRSDVDDVAPTTSCHWRGGAPDRVNIPAKLTRSS